MLIEPILSLYAIWKGVGEQKKVKITIVVILMVEIIAIISLFVLSALIGLT